MLIAQNLLPLIQEQLGIFGHLTTMVHRFSKSSKAIVVNEKYEKRFLFNLFISTIFVIVCWLQLLIYYQQLTMPQRAESFWILVAITTYIVIVAEHYRQRKDIVENFGWLVKLEKRYNPKNWLPLSAQKGFGHRVPYYIKLGTSTVPSVAFCAWIRLLRNPCLPYSPGFAMISACRSNTNSQFSPLTSSAWDLVFYIVSPTFSAYTVLYTLSNSALEFGMYTSLLCYCFSNYIELLSRNVKLMKTSNMNAIVRMYREIRIIVGVYNNIHRGILALCSTALCSFVFTTCAYLLIGHFQSISIPTLFINSLLFCDCAILIIDCDGRAKGRVNVESNLLIRQMKKSQLIMRSKRNRQHVRSFQAMKIYIGYNNYFDQLISLNVLHFNVNQTVDLLMM